MQNTAHVQLLTISNDGNPLAGSTHPIVDALASITSHIFSRFTEIVNHCPIWEALVRSAGR